MAKQPTGAGRTGPTPRTSRPTDPTTRRETRTAGGVQSYLLQGEKARRLGVTLATIVLYLLVVVLLSPYLSFHAFVSEEGATARRDVYAPRTFTVEDVEATAHAREDLIQRAPRVWKFDGNVESEAHQRLNRLLTLIEDEAPASEENLKAFAERLARDFDLTLDLTTINRLLPQRLRSLDPPLSLREVGRELNGIIGEVLGLRTVAANKAQLQAHDGQGVLHIRDSRGRRMARPDITQVLDWRGGVRDYLIEQRLRESFAAPGHGPVRQATAELLMRLLEPNLRYDSELSSTLRDRMEADLRANPKTRTFQADELIVKRGERLTRLQADALSYLNDENRRTIMIQMGGIALLTAIFFMAVAIYLRRFRARTQLNARLVALHVLPPLLALAAGQAMLVLGADRQTVMLWFPSAMVGMLSALLIAPQVGFVLVLVVCCLFGLVQEQGLEFLVLAVFGGFTAVLASRSIRRRLEVLQVGLTVAVVNAATLWIFALINGEWVPDWAQLLAVCGNGLVCAVATFVLLVVFESAFDIVTDPSLLELTGIDHTLIRRLEDIAPGSYQHVLNVTKLAEAAAHEIGANYLLVRAGAYFHDVGKMVKPKYFSENQVTLDDKKAHARLSPNMSVLIIKNHVKEGIRLAREYDLPEKVVDFIPQHHGTSLIRYFHTAALKRYEESADVAPVNEEDFRYPGPKPQSIETAIVMLADAVEAIVTSRFTGGQVAEPELRRTVQMAISDRFNDGQFDECPLTLRDLHSIREAFVKSLMARFHFRIIYPAQTQRPAA